MNKANPGLEGVIAAETALSSVDGERGELIIAGHRVEDFADRATFEETVHLLWRGRWPNEGERRAFAAELGKRRALAPAVLEVIGALARAKTPPMEALRTAISALSLQENVDDLAIAAAFPTAIAAYERFARGLQPIAPDPARGHAEDFLRMLDGEVPSSARVRAVDTYLNTTVDHGLNASTFVARAIISTQSDLVSAVTGAIGALKGPLHGGAPGPVLELLREVLAAPDPEAHIRAKLARGERLMGFGHRIYRVRDPRADVLGRACEALRAAEVVSPLFERALEIERIALRVLREHKPDRALETNVEFYTALLLDAAGVPKALFSTMFAMSRVAGWIAHAKEQLATKKLVRPQSVYVGPRPLARAV
jgi:citrate synthase